MSGPQAPEPSRITNEAGLRARFGGVPVTLADGAVVTFAGAATVAPGAAFAGECHFADGVSIGQGAILTDVTLGRDAAVRPYSILTDVRAGDRVLLGPFCFLRDGCEIGDDCIIGAHVEAARSRFGEGVKISHRAFIGDSEIGARSIVGAGVVFCNWDGEARQATRVGADVTVGSGTLLVPPLTIGEGAVLAAGSTVTKDVPAGARIIQKRG